MSIPLEPEILLKVLERLDKDLEAEIERTIHESWYGVWSHDELHQFLRNLLYEDAIRDKLDQFLIADENFGAKWQALKRQAAIEGLCESYRHLSAPEDYPPPKPVKGFHAKMRFRKVWINVFFLGYTSDGFPVVRCADTMSGVCCLGDILTFRNVFLYIKDVELTLPAQTPEWTLKMDTDKLLKLPIEYQEE